MSNARISCPTCDRMGRVTVVMPNGKLTTTTCGDCNGYGDMDCVDPECRYCVAARARVLPVSPPVLVD